MEGFQPPTLTFFRLAPLPFSQTSQDAIEDLSNFVCLLWTSCSLSTQPRGGSSPKQDILSIALAPMPLSDEPEMILTSFAALHCWLMATRPSVPILGGLQVG